MEVCQTHSKPCEFVCLDQSCSSEVLNCFVCIKEQHKQCSDQMVLEIDSEIGRVSVEPPSERAKAELKQIGEYMKKKVASLEGEMGKYKEGFSKGMIEEKDLKDPLAVNWGALKRNARITLDEKTKQIHLSSKLSEDPAEQEKAIAAFDQKLGKTFDEFVNKFSQIKIATDSSYAVEDWVGSKEIEVRENLNQHKISRAEGSTQTNYFFKLLEISKSKLKAKVTVDKINPQGYYVYIGLCSEETFKKLAKKSFSQNLCNETFLWYGSSFANMSGSTQIAQQAGTEFFVEYNEGTKFKIYDQSGTLNYQSNSNCKENVKYYLFVILYTQGIECSIEFLTK